MFMSASAPTTVPRLHARKLRTFGEFYRAFLEGRIVHAEHLSTGLEYLVRDVQVFEDDILVEMKTPCALVVDTYDEIIKKGNIEFSIILVGGDDF